MGQVDRIAEPWGTRTAYGPGERWPVRVDVRLVETDWDTAMSAVAGRTKKLFAEIMVTP
ncbi:hypothetical protein [Kribbella sp. NPDC004536]|uniref:hypothetical protein n=1 Tax=Kribbella sp. NPDC004536 TaxID=3364106 RepID=UPI0036A0A904